MLAATMPLAGVGGHQHLGCLVNVTDHQRHGGLLGMHQGRVSGNQGDEQKQRQDLSCYLLGDRKCQRDPDRTS